MKQSRKFSQANSKSFNYEKVPPQAVDLEEAILGAIMIDSNCISSVMRLISAEVFYKESHQKIFLACKHIYDSMEPVDILTVTEKLRTMDALELTGGAYYITSLTNRVSSGLNVESHCLIVLERYMKRKLIQSSQETIMLAYDDTTDPFDCVGILEQSLVGINEIMASGGNMQSVDGILNKVEAEARKRVEQFQNGKCTGIPTGINLLDRKTAGWQKSELIILAGRPAMGKTALMLHHALSAKVPVCIYSLEMSNISLVNRLILSMADLDADRFRRGAMGRGDWDQFYIAKEKLKGLPIYIDDNPIVTTRYIKSHTKMMHDRGKCDMIFVDYLQLADMRSEQTGRNREQEVSQAAREFKIIAKTLDIPVMVLSQLSRECEKRGDKKPMLSDLRESGAIEQDADIVIFAYRPSYYGLIDQHGNDQTGLGYEIIAKGRNIGVGDVPFRHNESMTQIYDYPVEEIPDPSSNPYKNQHDDVF